MLIQTREQFVAAKTTLMNADVIAVDTETTGLFYHLGDHIIGVSMACLLPGDENYMLSVYFPFRHRPKQMDLFTNSENLPEEWILELRDILLRPDVTLLFHNFKFDYKMLRNEGIQIPETTKVYCTMAMSHMIDENTRHSLEALGSQHFGENVVIEKQFSKKLVNKLGGWQKTSAKQLEPRACLDVELTYWLWKAFVPELEQQELTQLWSREKEFLHCLLEMEWQGIQIDIPLAEKLAAEARARMRVLEDEMGFDPGKSALLAHKLYASPPEGLGLTPGPLTKTSNKEFPQGIPKMDQEILSRYQHPFVDMVLEYKKLVKANSTWYEGWPKKADKSGRIHPSYNAGLGQKFGTVTGRLSSSEPNVQQMPRSKETPVRRIPIPPPRYRMYEFDYSQIEQRLAACYAEDELYYKAFREGLDPHQVNADAMGVSRQAAKHAAYTIQYGGEGDTLKATLERLEFQETGNIIEFPLEEAKAIIQEFWKVHPNLKEKTKEAERTARTRGYVRYWTGRRRHFNPKEFWEHRKAFNSVVQGGASEIVKETMLKFHRKRESKPYRMVLQVHDSLWFEVPDDFRDDYIKEIKEIMEWPTEQFPIPFDVDVKLMREAPEHESELLIA